MNQDLLVDLALADYEVGDWDDDTNEDDEDGQEDDHGVIGEGTNDEEEKDVPFIILCRHDQSKVKTSSDNALCLCEKCLPGVSSGAVCYARNSKK